MLQKHYLLNLLEYVHKFFIDGQASSFNVSTKVPPGAQTVFHKKGRESLECFQHFLENKERPSVCMQLQRSRLNSLHPPQVHGLIKNKANLINGFRGKATLTHSTSAGKPLKSLLSFSSSNRKLCPQFCSSFNQ